MVSDPVHVLRLEYRRQLEQFYTHLNLAPPYHSIEKSVQYLANTLKTKSEDFRQGLLHNKSEQGAFFQEIFLASGLCKKHRGIIQRLADSVQFTDTPPEPLRFLKQFSNKIK